MFQGKENQRMLLVPSFSCNIVFRLSIRPSLTQSHGFCMLFCLLGFFQLTVWISFPSSPWNNQCKHSLRSRKLEGALSSCIMAVALCLRSTPFPASSLLDSGLTFLLQDSLTTWGMTSAVKLYSWMDQQKQFKDSWCSLAQSARAKRPNLPTER